MGKVYRVGSYHGVRYCNTSKEADRYKPGGEEPESIDCLDAADECNQLEHYIAEITRNFNEIRMMLEELHDRCPVEFIQGTDIGHRLSQFIADYPLPPADAADRDGQRSYGV